MDKGKRKRVLMTTGKTVVENGIYHVTQRALKIRAFIEGIAAQGGNKFRDVNALLYCIAQLRSQGYAYEEIAQKLKINRATIYRCGNKTVPDRNVARMT